MLMPKPARSERNPVTVGSVRMTHAIPEVSHIELYVLFIVELQVCYPEKCSSNCHAASLPYGQI